MSKPSIQTPPNFKAPNSAIPAQSSQSRVSSWSKGPPAFANPAPNTNPAVGNAPGAPTAPAPARQQSTGTNGAPASRGTHSRKPSTLGPNAPNKDSVTMPRNVPGAQIVQPLSFGSISDSPEVASSPPRPAPSIPQNMDVKSFGTIRAEPAPAPNAPTKQSSGDPKQQPTPPPSATSTPAIKPKRKFNVESLFQTNSAESKNGGQSSSSSPVPSSPSINRNGIASPKMSPAMRGGQLPNNGYTPLSPSMSNRRLPNGGPSSPQFHRAQPSGPMGGPNGHRNGPQQNNNGPQQQASGAAMNSPQMPPGQLPQPQPGVYGYAPFSPMMQHPQGPRMDNGMQQYGVYAPYGYPQPDPYGSPTPWYPTMQGMPPPPPPQQQQQQPPPQAIPQHIPPHAQTSPMTNSPRISHLPPPTPSTPHALPLTPSTPTLSSRPIPALPPPQNPTLSRAAPAFQPRNSNRSSAIIIKAPDGTVVDMMSQTKPRPVAIVPPPTHSRTPSIAPSIQPAASESFDALKKPTTRPPVRLESAEDRAKRLKAEEDKKQQAEAEEKAKKDAEEAAARAVAEAEAARVKAEEEAALKVKEEAERKVKEEEEQARLQKEKEEAEAKEVERLRLEAEAEAKRELEEKAKQAALEEESRRKAEEEERAAAEAKSAAAAKAADAAREADVAAASAKAEADRLESELAMQQKTTLPSTPELTVLKPSALKRPTPGKLDLSSANAKHIAGSAPMSALASARIIDDIAKTPYPEGIRSPAPELNANASDGKFRYDRDFLLQFFKVCVEKPDSLPDLDALGISANGEPGTVSRPQRPRTQSSMGPPSRVASSSGLPFGGGKGAFGGAMGSFTSAGNKASSAERFAAANTMSRSVSSAGMNRAGGTPLSRSSSQGGVGMLPHSPKDGHATTRTRSSRGGRRSDKPNNGGGNAHFSSPSMSTLSLEPVAPLERSENRWVPDSVAAPNAGAASNESPAAVDNPAIVERKVKALLNKLTMEKFEKLSDQIIAWANKSEQEKDGATLILVIKLIFEKATDEAAWSEMYARLCRKMMEKISPNVQDESVRNSAGQPIVGGHLFRKYLLNRCQEDFQRGWAVKESTAAAAAGKAADDRAQKAANEGKAEEETILYSDEYYAAEKAKRRGLGLVKFIGELFKLSMLTERIMHECIKQLLSNIENPEEEDIESLCRLLITVGQAMDTERARDHMNVYFTRMAELAKGNSISSRVKYMVQDVIELRSRRWQARNNVAAPQTIAQVHAEAAKDQATAERVNLARSMNPPMSRTGSRRGGQRGEEVTQDGWNVAGSNTVQRVPTNLSNFGKIGKTATPTSSNPFNVYTKKGAKTSEATPTLTRAQSNANMFSALNSEAPADLPPPPTPSSRGPSRKPSLDLGPGGLPEGIPARKKLVLAPRTVAAETAEENVAEQPEAEEAATSDSSMTAAQAETRIAEDIKEFWNGRNIEEGRHYFTAITPEHRHILVSKLASSALDKKEDDVKLVADLFSTVAGDTCSEESFEAGLVGIVEAVDDLSVDVPKAYSFVARLLRGSKLPEAKVEELSHKIIFEGDPLKPPPKKLMDEFAKLA